jgi:hypothetical protein
VRWVLCAGKGAGPQQGRCVGFVGWQALAALWVGVVPCGSNLIQSGIPDWIKIEPSVHRVMMFELIGKIIEVVELISLRGTYILVAGHVLHLPEIVFS